MCRVGMAAWEVGASLTLPSRRRQRERGMVCAARWCMRQRGGQNMQAPCACVRKEDAALAVAVGRF